MTNTGLNPPDDGISALPNMGENGYAITQVDKSMPQHPHNNSQLE